MNMIEEAGVKAMHLCLIKNKETRRFTGLAISVLVGNNTLRNWMTERKENLGDARWKMERGGSRKHEMINVGTTILWKKIT